MLNAEEVKQFALAAGADAIRIGPMSEWEGTPKENDPRYIMPDAETIIGVAFRMPRGTLRGIEEGTFFSPHFFFNYNHLNNTYAPMVLRKLVCFIEDHGYEATPLAGWDPWGRRSGEDNDDPSAPQVYSRPVAPGKPAPDVRVSPRRAAVISRLGEIGWSGMILTPEFGPLTRAMFIITEAPLECDAPPAALCDRCMECARHCSGKAIPVPPCECEHKTVAGKKIEYGKLNLARCSNAGNGGTPELNPFWDPAVKRNPEWMEQYRSPELFGAAGPCPQVMRSGDPRIEGGRGCLRACYIHLEQQEKLSRKFHTPFRRRPEWSMK